LPPTVTGEPVQPDRATDEDREKHCYGSKPSNRVSLGLRREWNCPTSAGCIAHATRPVATGRRAVTAGDDTAWLSDVGAMVSPSPSTNLCWAVLGWPPPGDGFESRDSFHRRRSHAASSGLVATTAQTVLLLAVVSTASTHTQAACRSRRLSRGSCSSGRRRMRSPEGCDQARFCL
jgi:hypothetical protein